jgi:hypothetical protein
LLFLLTTVIPVSAVGCNRTEDSGSSSQSSVSVGETAQLGTFNIEFVRKNIIVKGKSFEVPVSLKDLPEGWTWKEHEDSKYNAEGSGLAYIYYNGDEMLIAGLENYFEGSENNGIIYNLTNKTNDRSIDGLTPFESTKNDVVEKYGELNEITQGGNYRYGTTNNNDKFGGRMNEQRLTVKFDDNDKIIMVSITYADLTKEKY